ncbi:MAG: hypothetical protein DMG81_20580 [Acidobacteria bacterium]|nr:MAG: hypothetical protein DMG81_20580 [Acidobacteriota bacterium]
MRDEQVLIVTYGYPTPQLSTRTLIRLRQLRIEWARHTSKSYFPKAPRGFLRVAKARHGRVFRKKRLGSLLQICDQWRTRIVHARYRAPLSTLLHLHHRNAFQGSDNRSLVHGRGQGDEPVLDAELIYKPLLTFAQDLLRQFLKVPENP